MHVKTPTGFGQHLRAPIACASLATLALAGTALADRTVKTDPRGDAKSSGPMKIDLKAGAASHARGKLVHTVDVHGRLPAGPASPAALPGAPPLPIAIYIDTSPRRGPEYSVQAFPHGTSVDRLRDGKTTGVAGFRKVDRNTLRYSFSPRAIGRPGRYGWRVAVEGGGDRQVDALPNRGFVKHKLSR